MCLKINQEIKMKTLLLTFLAHLVFVIVSAQEDATVTGKVLDGESAQPLPYTTVSILSGKDGKIVDGTITNESGRFVFEGLPDGDFRLSIDFMGFQSKEVPLLIGKLNRNYDLGDIVLESTSQELSEVTITGKRATVAASLAKKNFNIDDNISQSGGSAMDAMRNLPGVTVDPEGKILLRGSDNVSVLIDGKSSSLTGFGNQKGLDNIPASNIARIEIINNPSAKYNAAGMAGIVNIIYKKEKETGWNGEIGFTTGLGELTQRRENLPDISEKYSATPKFNPNFSLNYRTGKLNIFVQADGITRKRVNTNEFTEKDYTDGKPDILSQFLENRTQKLYNLKGGIDWSIDENNDLSIFALREYEEHVDLGDVPFDFTETGERRRLWLWREDEQTKFINYSASFTHRFEQPGHELNLTYLYTGGGEDELFTFSDSSAVRQSGDATRLIVNEYVHNISLDYVRPLKSGRIEFGSKIGLRSIPITYDIIPGENSILDPQLGDFSEYTENVYALYANYIWQQSKFDVEAGMRFEPSFVKYKLDPDNIYYDTTSYEYFPLFPNIRVTKKFNSYNTLSLFYNRRVDRPGEFEVRPFPKYDDPELLKTGNPALRPQFTQNIELSYKRSWDGGSAYGSLFYRAMNDIIARIFTEDSQSADAIINNIPQNLGKASNLGVEFVMDQKITDYWDVNANLNWYRNHINAFSGTLVYPYKQPFSFAESNAYTWNFKVNTNLEFGENWNFQATSVYYAPDIIPQGKVGSRYSLDFGLKRKFWDNKIETWLAVTDVLNTFQIKREINGDNFNLKATNYYETQVFTLGAKYKF